MCSHGRSVPRLAASGHKPTSNGGWEDGDPTTISSQGLGPSETLAGGSTDGSLPSSSVAIPVLLGSLLSIGRGVWNGGVHWTSLRGRR